LIFIYSLRYLPFKGNKLKYSTLSLVCGSTLLLNGCLDNNDNNKDVAQAINAQTEALSNQQSTEASVTFQGLVVDVFDTQAVNSALITVNLGAETFVDALVATEGRFEVSKLPPNSDIEVIISSSSDEFVTRAFFYNTGDSSTNVATKDFGLFAVSEPQVVKITVLNSDDNSSLDNLEFNAYSHVGDSSSKLKYKHTSTYDAVNGQYSITVPKHINTSVRANLDFNRDGEVDFMPESSYNLSNTDLYINTANSIEALTVYVEENAEAIITEVEFRVSIVDSASNSVTSAELFVDDVNNQMVKSVYDSATEQYVVTAKFSEQITLSMPAFSDNDVNYQSASIRLFRNSDDLIDVRTSGTDGNWNYDIPSSETIELAILPRITTNASALEVITKTYEIDQANAIFKVFYSQGVTIPSESISLERTTGFTTVKGNDSTDDLILSGSTLFTGGDLIATSHTMKLNNTKLEVTPVSPLLVFGDYKYNVGNVEVSSTEDVTDINGDSLSFKITHSSQIFDINDVKLDNENFTTNGVTITTANTANEASTSVNYDRSVYFYLPTSINSLQNFTMRQLSVNEDNTARTDARSFTFVNNGSIYTNRVGTVKLAENEIVVTDGLQTNVITSSAQEDSQVVYRTYNHEYMSDDTSSSTNTISFEYAYETKTGDVTTGTIVIPVQ